MSFFNDFFNNGHLGFFDGPHPGYRRAARRPPTELERAQHQLQALAQENEELQARLNDTEHELQLVQRKMKVRPTPPKSEGLEERLRETELKLAQYVQKFGDLEKTRRDFGKGPTRSGQAQRTTDQHSPVQSPENLILGRHESSEQNGFYIEEEQNVSVKDQQIHELKQTVRDLSSALVDYNKYKRYFEAHSSQSVSQRDDSQMSIELTDPKTLPETSLEECRAQKMAYFQGTLVDGKKTGFCREVDPQGNIFEGTYADGIRNGQGKLDCSDYTFEGVFAEGVPQESQGKMTPKTKSQTMQLNDFCVFRGPVAGGVPTGEGVLRFSNGVSLRGTFDKGQISAEFPVVFSGPEVEKEVPAELIQVQGLDALVVKPSEGRQTFIWNLKSGELKLI